MPEGGTIPEGLLSPAGGAPCLVLLRAGRAALEAPETLDPLLDAATRQRLRVAVLLDDRGLGLPARDAGGPAAAEAPVDFWIALVNRLVRRLGERVSVYGIFERPALRFDARAYAYLLKRAAVAIRAARPAALIAAGALHPGDRDWAAEVFGRDAAPYVDLFLADGAPSLAAVIDLRDRLDPASGVWVVNAAIDPASARASAVDACVRSLAGGAGAVFFAADTPPDLAPFAASLRALLPPNFAPAAPAILPFDPASTLLTPPPAEPGAGEPAAGVPPGPAAPAGAGRGPVVATPARPASLETFAFHDTRRREGIVAYRSPRAGDADWLRLALRAPVESLALVNPATMSEASVGGAAAAGRIVFIPVRPDMLFLRYRLAAAILPVQETGVGAVTELTAEEIIALERQFGAAQRARLRHYEARAGIGIHYRITAVAQSIDVLTENRLYVHDGKQDYEQTDLFVEGARWRGKTPPYLPFIQPDKVSQVPLDILLDEDYRYTLAGRDRVDGRDCYVLEFEPTAADLSLYRGKVFVDAQSFARVRMEAVQTGLAEPIRSNQMTYSFGPVTTPGGTYWLPLQVTGQMVFEVLGQNLVVERDARYSEFVINGEEFDARLAAALGSGRPLYRETDEGFYRLDTSGGEERLESASIPRNVFLVMGINIGSSGQPGFPFAGANWFDFDFRGTGTQFNLAWAGPFADISWTNPRLTAPRGGSAPLALTLRASLNAWPKHDKNATQTGSASREDLDIYQQSVRAALAIPMGHFLRWSLEPRATYMNFDAYKSTDPESILPPTMVDYGALLRLEFTRSGYVLGAWGEAGRRTDWGVWGLPGQKFSRDDRDYTRLGTNFRKSIYLGEFDKLNFGASGFLGRSLDRFSRFEIGDFRAARVRGYNGSGIHFDRGVVAEASYSFSIGQAVRVDAGLQSAWIRSDDDFGDAVERVVGSGVAFEFSGPWSTVISVRASHPVSTTLDDVGGGGDVRIVAIRTFDRWGRGERARKPPAPPPPVPEVRDRP